MSVWANLGEVKSPPKHLSTGCTCLLSAPTQLFWVLRLRAAWVARLSPSPPTLHPGPEPSPACIPAAEGTQRLICLSVLEPGCWAAPWVGAAGKRPWGAVGAATVLIFQLVPCPHLGQETHTLGFFLSLLSRARPLPWFRPLSCVFSPDNQERVLKTKRVVSTGLHTSHACPLNAVSPRCCLSLSPVSEA